MPQHPNTDDDARARQQPLTERDRTFARFLVRAALEKKRRERAEQDREAA